MVMVANIDSTVLTAEVKGVGQGAGGTLHDDGVRDALITVRAPGRDVLVERDEIQSSSANILDRQICLEINYRKRQGA